MEGMKEYIERTEIKSALQPVTRDGSCPLHIAAAVDQVLDCTPAADVVEVRHGRWIGLEYDGYADGDPVYDLWECSECGEEVRGEDVPVTHPWCHCCGARMGKEAEHEVS